MSLHRIIAALGLLALAAPALAQPTRVASTAQPVPARRAFAHQRHIRMEFHAPSGWTIVELMTMALDEGGRTELRSSFRFPGHEPPNVPGTVTFAVVGRAKEEIFPAKPELSLVLDGGTPIVVAATRFAMPRKADTVETTVYATMPRATFLRLTSATQAEVRVDDRRWSLAPDMLEGLRDLASRMSPAGYRAAKREEGMVAASTPDSAGAARTWLASEVDVMVKPRGPLRRPHFPADAEATRRRVFFRYVVDSTGLVVAGTLRGETPKADTLFLDALRDAAARWVFTPARKDGRPVRVEIRQAYEFVPGQ
jgi:hypothetical protein